MNRMEMFVELKKDSSKIFKSGNRLHLYFVEGESIKYEYKGIVKDVNLVNFDDKGEYTEVTDIVADKIKRYIRNLK